MVYDHIKVSREARRIPDDQETLASYDYQTEYSDDFTLSGDDDDRASLSDSSSVSSYDSILYDRYVPSYRVPKTQGVRQPVYEAWVVYCSADNKEVVSGTKICGVNVFQHWDQLYGNVSTRPVGRPQSELTGMHLSAIDRYQTANKRSLPSRLVRGRAKSYEQDLDDRLRKLPKEIQSEINTLLADRRDNSSNRYHVRGWSVALIREHLHYRFNPADPEEVKRHKLRFWKNKNKDQPTEYLIVIRGEETIFPEDDRGHFCQTRFGNPWNRVDKQEQKARNLAEEAKAFEFDKLGGRRRARSRRRAPRPVFRERVRARSITPPPPPPVMHYGRAPRHFGYPAPPPPPAPPLPRFPCNPPPPPMPHPMPGHVPSFAYTPPPPPAPPVCVPPPPGIPLPPRPYSYNPPAPLWSFAPPANPVPLGGPSVPYFAHCGPMMHPPASMGLRPNFPPPPPPPPPMSANYSPPMFSAPPPPPMPSNLTTPTFTATASERSVPPYCICHRVYHRPCGPCRLREDGAKSDADISELAVLEETDGAEEKKLEKTTDSGLGDDDVRDDQSLYD